MKPGTTDPDYPDIPLGGWTGVIAEVDQRSNPPLYFIEWDERTLNAMHPIYRSRCERDDAGVESMWLDENDIEPNTGEPAVIEQSTNIITCPLVRLGFPVLRALGFCRQLPQVQYVRRGVWSNFGSVVADYGMGKKWCRGWSIPGRLDLGSGRNMVWSSGRGSEPAEVWLCDGWYLWAALPCPGVGGTSSITCWS